MDRALRLVRPLSEYPTVEELLEEARALASLGYIVRVAEGKACYSTSDPPDLPGTDPSVWIAYPSGLAIPETCVPWFWAFADGSIRLGNWEQCCRYADRLDLPDPIYVDPEDVHGTCVLIADEHDWRFEQARSFPAFAGV